MHRDTPILEINLCKVHHIMWSNFDASNICNNVVSTTFTPEAITSHIIWWNLASDSTKVLLPSIEHYLDGIGRRCEVYDGLCVSFSCDYNTIKA